MVRVQSVAGMKQLIKWVQMNLFVLLLFSTQTVLSGNIVKHLPWFDGELPFKLETGYISVDDSELFYYFIESEGNPGTDPLFLWLTGGPGCTAFSGLIYEIGPLEYDVENYTGGFPKLRYYPYGHTKVASIIFLDAPVGTGFSYSRTLEGWSSSDMKSSEQSYKFLRNWLIEHPQYLSVPLFIGGDSYAGLYVPLITKKVIEGNTEKLEPYMNIKGYLVGSPMTDKFIDMNSFVDFAHRLAIISDEIYENAKKSCNGDYVTADPTNTACIAAVAAILKCVKPLNAKDILKPNCDLSSSDRRGNMCPRSLEENAPKFLVSQTTVLRPWCTTFGLTHTNAFGNDERVREALHIRKGTKGYWMRCNSSLLYNHDVLSVVSVHKELSKLNLKVLVESGDHDLNIPYVGTLKWIKSLDLSLNEEWRPWFVDDQVAGYTTRYTEKEGYRLTFATVKGAGHPAPEFNRKECYDLFDRWIHDHPI